MLHDFYNGTNELFEANYGVLAKSVDKGKQRIIFILIIPWIDKQRKLTPF